MLWNLRPNAPQLVISKGDGPRLLINRDTTNNIYIGASSSVGTSGEIDQSILDALAFIGVSGDEDVWCVAASGNPQLDVVTEGTSWAPSPAQTQAQLNSLIGVMGNPAQDTTVASVRTTLGAPAQTADISGVRTTLGTPAQTADIGNLHSVGHTIASEVGLTGTPLLGGKSTQANKVINNSIPKNTSAHYGPYTFGQIGYEIQFQCNAASGGVGPDYVQVQFQWSDSLSGIQVYQKTFTVIAGAFANPHWVVGSGPARGDTLDVYVINVAKSVDAIQSSFTLLETSRIFTRDRWRTLSGLLFNTLNVTSPGATGVPIDSNGICNVSASVALGGGTTTRSMALYNGQAYIKLRTNSNTTDGEVSIFDNSGTFGNDGTVYHNWTDAHGDINDRFELPPAQCEITLTNHNAAAEVMSACITCAELEV